jgi:hypothetical protein
MFVQYIGSSQGVDKAEEKEKFPGSFVKETAGQG